MTSFPGRALRDRRREGRASTQTADRRRDRALRSTARAWRVASVKEREVRRNAAAPFTTSTLQQEASRKLKFRVRRAMQLAQALYEGVDLGASEGTAGLITYMRTDSTRISDRRASGARVHRRARTAKSSTAAARHRVREGAQDAHEAIRPTSVLAHARTRRRRAQARRAAALHADLGALRRLADGAGRLRPDDRRRRAARRRTRSARPAAC